MVKINGLERIESQSTNRFGWLSNFTGGPLGICGIILFSVTMGLGIHSRSIATQLANARKETDPPQPNEIFKPLPFAVGDGRLFDHRLPAFALDW